MEFWVLGIGLIRHRERCRVLGLGFRIGGLGHRV
jgi:hypothetical protein